LGSGSDFKLTHCHREYRFQAGVDYEVFDSPDLADQTRRGGNRRSLAGDAEGVATWQAIAQRIEQLSDFGDGRKRH